MQCTKPERQINAYIDGEMDFVQKEAMKNHLGRCSRCQRIEKRLLRAKEALLLFKKEAAPQGISIDLAAVYAGASFRPRPGKTRKIFFFLFLLFAFYFLLFTFLYRPAKIRVFPLVGEAVVSTADASTRIERWKTVLVSKGGQVDTEPGNLALLELENGAFIILKENTRVDIALNRYNRAGGAAHYALKLRHGFIIAALDSPGARLSVQTDQLCVDARQTVFSVEAANGRRSFVEIAKGAATVKVLDIRFYRTERGCKNMMLEACPSGLKTNPMPASRQEAILNAVGLYAGFLKSVVVKPSGAAPRRGRIDYWVQE